MTITTIPFAGLTNSLLVPNDGSGDEEEWSAPQRLCIACGEPLPDDRYSIYCEECEETLE